MHIHVCLFGRTQAIARSTEPIRVEPKSVCTNQSQKQIQYNNTIPNVHMGRSSRRGVHSLPPVLTSAPSTVELGLASALFGPPKSIPTRRSTPHLGLGALRILPRPRAAGESIGAGSASRASELGAAQPSPSSPSASLRLCSVRPTGGRGGDPFYHITGHQSRYVKSRRSAAPSWERRRA